MKQLLQDYLNAPNKEPNAIIAEMLKSPDRAFEVLLNFNGPYPENLSAIDVFPDYIQPLLKELVKRFPRLILDSDLYKMGPGQRSTLIQITIELENPEFAGLITNGLSDRSVVVKEVVVKAISRLKFLHTPETKKQLEKLLQLKSMSYLAKEIRRALESFET